MPLLLSIETATKLCSVALAHGSKILAVRELESDKNIHAEKVNVYIDEVMREAGKELTALDAVAVGIGPGSYTGLRIGLSAAKGLCYALDRPIIGIPTLNSLLQRAREVAGARDAEWWPMIDARRMEVFAQSFDGAGKALSAIAPLILDTTWAIDGTKRIVFGDGADKAVEIWKDALNLEHLPGIRPSAVAMIPEALRRFEAGSLDDLAYLVPAYGKAANVTQPKKKAK